MLLKVGMAMMAVALAFTAIAAGIAMSLHDEPEPAIAAKPVSESASEPPLKPRSQAEPNAKPNPSPSRSAAETVTFYRP